MANAIAHQKNIKNILKIKIYQKYLYLDPKLIISSKPLILQYLVTQSL